MDSRIETVTFTYSDSSNQEISVIEKESSIWEKPYAPSQLRPPKRNKNIQLVTI
jgi:hypothetical protein